MKTKRQSVGRVKSGSLTRDEETWMRTVEEINLSLFHEVESKGGALLQALQDVDTEDPYCMGFVRGFEAGLGVGMDSILADVNRAEQNRERG